MPISSSKSGGIFLPAGIFAGLGLGALAGEPMIGVLAGTASGAAAATWLWWRERHSGQS